MNKFIVRIQRYLVWRRCRPYFHPAFYVFARRFTLIRAYDHIQHIWNIIKCPLKSPNRALQQLSCDLIKDWRPPGRWYTGKCSVKMNEKLKFPVMWLFQSMGQSFSSLLKTLFFVQNIHKCYYFRLEKRVNFLSRQHVISIASFVNFRFSDRKVGEQEHKLECWLSIGGILRMPNCTNQCPVCFKSSDAHSVSIYGTDRFYFWKRRIHFWNIVPKMETFP